MSLCLNLTCGVHIEQPQSSSDKRVQADEDQNTDIGDCGIGAVEMHICVCSTICKTIYYFAGLLSLRLDTTDASSKASQMIVNNVISLLN